jgi:hypothetical protein
VLRRRSLVAWNRKDFADLCRQRIGDGRLRRGQRNAEPAEQIILMVVTVPAAVVLRERDRKRRWAVDVDRFLESKYRIARLIAAAVACVDAPGGLVLAIDRKLYRADDALPTGAVVERRLQR